MAELKFGTVMIVSLMVKRLMDGDPATRAELAEDLGMHRMTVNRYLRLWHKMKMVRVAEWVKVGPHVVARFEWNQDGLRDAPRPARKSNALRQAEKRRRAAVKLTGGMYA